MSRAASVCCMLAWLGVSGTGAAIITPPHPGMGVLHEAMEGESTTLACSSNDDDDHRFLFWQLEDDRAIGPGNNVDDSKYKYEVLSGDLVIKGLTKEDSGMYKCVSEGISIPSFAINSVELEVKKDWLVAWESDASVNLLRGVLAMMLIAVVCGITYMLLRMRRTGYIKTDDLSEDDMPDDAGDSPYHSTTRRLSQQDNLSLVDTELPRALNSMYNERL